MGRTKEDFDDMAMQVYSLSKQRLTKEQIGLYLGISRRQVHRYLNRATAIFRWMADNIDGKMHLGETLDAFIKQEEIALANAAACDPGSNVAVGWMNTAQKARTEIKKLLQECGFVFKMPETVEEGIDFQDEETRKEYLQWRARAGAKAREN